MGVTGGVSDLVELLADISEIPLVSCNVVVWERADRQTRFYTSHAVSELPDCRLVRASGTSISEMVAKIRVGLREWPSDLPRCTGWDVEQRRAVRVALETLIAACDRDGTYLELSKRNVSGDEQLPWHLFLGDERRLEGRSADEPLIAAFKPLGSHARTGLRRSRPARG